MRCQSRRAFIKAMGATATLTAAGYFGIGLFGRNPALALPAPPPDAFPSIAGRTLVIVEMGGGNDGLNMVVPHANARYHDLRRDLAITDAIDLDGEVGLHPALGFVAERYGAGDVALIEGVGYPDPDLSHFASMSTWWSGMPGAVGATGWLGRYLDGTVGGSNPLAGVSIGPGPNPALVGDAAIVASIQSSAGIAPAWIDDPDELFGMWSGFAPQDADPGSPLAVARDAISDTVAASAAIGSRLDGVDAEGRDLASYLTLAAALTVAPDPPRVIVVHGWGDFDTHEGQATRQEALMGQLDEALRTFFTTIEAAQATDHVVVATTSEFGRRANYNGSGTDHGTASNHFVIGSPVAGGRIGEPVDLASLDPRGNPTHTLDFRSYYASLLDGWLGTPHEAVLGQSIETLDLVGSTGSSATAGRPRLL
ncbi:MAG: DUF1501 domain-containing protein [Acidimicrobiia bacterium]|nr:DUF1501 domain-containing protein [Acidimicrobiia bacterium]